MLWCTKLWAKARHDTGCTGYRQGMIDPRNNERHHKKDRFSANDISQLWSKDTSEGEWSGEILWRRIEVVNSCFLSLETRAHYRVLSLAQQGQTAMITVKGMRGEKGERKTRGRIEQMQRDPVICVAGIWGSCTIPIWVRSVIEQLRICSLILCIKISIVCATQI